MIILSDLHLGAGGEDAARIREMTDFLRQVIGYVEKYRPQVLILAGDVFSDPNPPDWSVKLLQDAIDEMHARREFLRVFAISGESDIDVQDGVCSFSKLKGRRFMRLITPFQDRKKICSVITRMEDQAVTFYLLPYFRPSMFRGRVGEGVDGNVLSYEMTLKRLLDFENLSSKCLNVLVSHQFYYDEDTGSNRTEREESENTVRDDVDAIPASLLDRFDFAALGHLYRPRILSGKKAVYPGTPFDPVSGKAHPERGIALAEISQGKEPVITLLPFVPFYEGQERPCETEPGRRAYRERCRILALAENGQSDEILDTLLRLLPPGRGDNGLILENVFRVIRKEI